MRIIIGTVTLKTRNNYLDIIFFDELKTYQQITADASKKPLEQKTGVPGSAPVLEEIKIRLSIVQDEHFLILAMLLP